MFIYIPIVSEERLYQRKRDVWRFVIVISLGLTFGPIAYANFFEDVGNAVTNTIIKPVETINEKATEVLTKANTEATNAAKTINTEVTNAAAKGNEEATKAGAQANSAVTGQVTQVNTVVTQGLQQSAKQAQKLVQDAKWNIDKAGKDVEAETGRFGHNLEDAAHAIGHYLEHEAQGTGQTLNNAERRLREGKVVDALWHLGTEPLQHTSDNAAIAVQESEYLNTVAQVAATAYGGGPTGAAAYAAWLTYKQTDNADLALRAGVLTYATSMAFKATGSMNADTGSQIARKAAITAAVGGIAVAAAGGNEAAIQEGFLKAGAMVLVQDGYKRYTGSALDARASEGDAYCMTAEGEACSPPESAYVKDDKGKIVHNAKGEPIIDMSKVDPRVPHVGLMGGAGNPNWSEERSPVMTSISKVPGMNAMALFHDQWTISWDMGTLTTPASIIPAIVLTYTGTGAPYYDLLKKTTVESSTKSDIQGVNTLVVPSPKVSDAQGLLVSVTSTETSQSEALFSTQSALTAISCENGPTRQNVVVDFIDGDSADCRVLTTSSTEPLKVLRSAGSWRDCMLTAETFTRQLISAGASCFIRDTASRIDSEAAPLAIRAAVNEQHGRAFPSFSLKTIGILFLAILVLVSGVIGYLFRDMKNHIKLNR
jgi:hypothetical protein